MSYTINAIAPGFPFKDETEYPVACSHDLMSQAGKYRIQGHNGQWLELKPGQLCLLYEALKNIDKIKQSDDPDLFRRILSISSKDEDGEDWRAIIYSDHEKRDVVDLRYVSGEELRRIENTSKPLVAEKKSELRSLKNDEAIIKKRISGLENEIERLEQKQSLSLPDGRRLITKPRFNYSAD